MRTHLAQVVHDALPHLHSTSEADASIRPAPGKWSKKEILGHLIDSAANNHQRLVRLHHRDPFDLMLIAQARAEDLTLITRDRVFSSYNIETLW